MVFGVPTINSDLVHRSCHTINEKTHGLDWYGIAWYGMVRYDIGWSMFWHTLVSFCTGMSRYVTCSYICMVWYGVQYNSEGKGGNRGSPLWCVS